MKKSCKVVFPLIALFAVGVFAILGIVFAYQSAPIAMAYTEVADIEVDTLYICDTSNTIYFRIMANGGYQAVTPFTLSFEDGVVMDNLGATKVAVGYHSVTTTNGITYNRSITFTNGASTFQLRIFYYGTGTSPNPYPCTFAGIYISDGSNKLGYGTSGFFTSIETFYNTTGFDFIGITFTSSTVNTDLDVQYLREPLAYLLDEYVPPISQYAPVFDPYVTPASNVVFEGYPFSEDSVARVFESSVWGIRVSNAVDFSQLYTSYLDIKLTFGVAPDDETFTLYNVTLDDGYDDEGNIYYWLTMCLAEQPTEFSFAFSLIADPALKEWYTCSATENDTMYDIMCSYWVNDDFADYLTDLRVDSIAAGYNSGYIVGIENNDGNNIVSVVWYTFEMPFKLLFGTWDSVHSKYVGGLFNFEILGLDIRAFVLSIMSVCIVIAIVKLILARRGG